MSEEAENRLWEIIEKNEDVQEYRKIIFEQFVEDANKNMKLIEKYKKTKSQEAFQNIVQRFCFDLDRTRLYMNYHDLTSRIRHFYEEGYWSGYVGSLKEDGFKLDEIANITGLSHDNVEYYIELYQNH